MPISRWETATREIAIRSASSCWVQPALVRRRAIRAPSRSTLIRSAWLRTSGQGALLLDAKERQVGLDHALNERREVDRRLPAEAIAGLGRVANQQIDLGRAHETLILNDMRS